MKRQIAAGEFKARCLHLLDEVRRSRNEVVITKRGQPVARLGPVEEVNPPVVGRMPGTEEVVRNIVTPLGERPETDE